jgi:hypothetical protein
MMKIHQRGVHFRLLSAIKSEHAERRDVLAANIYDDKIGY